VPSIFSDLVSSLADLERLFLAQWYALSFFIRTLVGFAAAASVLYGATRSEQPGWTMLLFFGAFGLFAYILALNFSAM
jgi:uncharacterized membrane protein HdeD (DUF308 family)